ncbi:RICIN domain-containing protein [Nocardiopsis sp. CNT312]|uniref:RICIN domain-containing protein n=1 Tax=Nocardiopsis sp. CNT312 TaxID=1137268 RepID=UPI0004AE5BEF|nr:RICIN domain-containing protein [Nocardiopsis sp. CNT312]
MQGRRIPTRAASLIGAALMFQAVLGGAVAHAAAPAEDTDARTPSRAQSNVYRFVNANSGLCAGVGGSSLEEGAGVIQWECLEIDDQAWHLNHVNNGFYHLENINSGQCLTVATPAGDGSRVVQMPCGKHRHQGWRLDKQGGMDLRFVNYEPKMTLAVADSSTRLGAPLILSETDARVSEVWTLKPVE